MTTTKLYFMLALVAVFAVGCAPARPLVFYQYKEGSPNFDAVKYECQAEALAAAQQINCTGVCQRAQQEHAESQANPSPAGGLFSGLASVACNNCLASRNHPSPAHWQACVSRKGWLPCEQGGQHLPQCQ